MLPRGLSPPAAHTPHPTRAPSYRGRGAAARRDPGRPRRPCFVGALPAPPSGSIHAFSPDLRSGGLGRGGGVLHLWGPEPQILPPLGSCVSRPLPKSKHTWLPWGEDSTLRGPGAGHGAKASRYISPRAPREASVVPHSLLATCPPPCQPSGWVPRAGAGPWPGPWWSCPWCRKQVRPKPLTPSRRPPQATRLCVSGRQRTACPPRGPACPRLLAPPERPACVGRS